MPDGAGLDVPGPNVVEGAGQMWRRNTTEGNVPEREQGRRRMSEFGSGRSVNSVAPLKAGSSRGPGRSPRVDSVFPDQDGN